MKWLESEIVTLRENTPREGLKSIWAHTMHLQGAASTYTSSNRELDYLSLLSATQVILADVERRLEKLEIKDMEGQISGWKKESVRDMHVQQAREILSRCCTQPRQAACPNVSSNHNNHNNNNNNHNNSHNNGCQEESIGLASPRMPNLR